MKTVNYSDEMVAQLRALAAEGKTPAEIASVLGRAVASVRAKMVRERLYKAPEKVAVVKDESPTKKEILAALAAKGFDVEGFDGATKAALTRLDAALAA